MPPTNGELLSLVCTFFNLAPLKLFIWPSSAPLSLLPEAGLLALLEDGGGGPGAEGGAGGGGGGGGMLAEFYCLKTTSTFINADKFN